MKSCIRAALACALAVSPVFAQEAVPLKTLPFSPARQAGGLLFISGQIARTADGADVKESVAAETHQTMKNIGRILEEHGYAYDDLVSVTVWLADIEDYHEMNKAYASYFKEQFPRGLALAGRRSSLTFGLRLPPSPIRTRMTMPTTMPRTRMTMDTTTMAIRNRPCR